MAGESSRFFKHGYNLPKYKLKLSNVTLLENILMGFSIYFKNDTFMFGLNPKFNDFMFVKSICKKLGIKKFIIIELDTITRGQADTVNIMLNSSKNFDDNEEIHIFNIDTIHLNFKKQSLKQIKSEGYLELFIGEGNQWSFAELDANDHKVIRVTEKKRISDYCSNGLYCFSSIMLFKYYFNIYEKFTDKELYIAPMYNLLIKDNLTIKGVILKKKNFIFCGTPQEYKMIKQKNVYI